MDDILKTLKDFAENAKTTFDDILRRFEINFKAKEIKESRTETNILEPPPRVTCGECGRIRGENAINCVMCQFALNMNHEREKIKRCFISQQQCIGNLQVARQGEVGNEAENEEIGPNDNEYDRSGYDPNEPSFQRVNGVIVYEGGMSLSRARKYLWELGKNRPQDVRESAFIGQTIYNPPEEPECTCPEHLERLKYKGGMTIDEAQEWLWIKNKDPIVESSEAAVED